ncbi:TPA: helix-turn-helix transcriptional regulator [Escherichia coli]|nr:helix-turn-helix transcriptional regulator [Escherichia coli]
MDKNNMSITNKKNFVSANIGNKIKNIRKSAGISGDTLAKNLGISQQQVSRYESGKSSMSIDMVILISYALNVSVNKLLSDFLDSDNIIDPTSGYKSKK